MLVFNVAYCACRYIGKVCGGRGCMAAEGLGGGGAWADAADAPITTATPRITIARVIVFISAPSVEATLLRVAFGS